MLIPKEGGSEVDGEILLRGKLEPPLRSSWDTPRHIKHLSQFSIQDVRLLFDLGPAVVEAEQRFSWDVFVAAHPLPEGRTHAKQLHIRFLGILKFHPPVMIMISRSFLRYLASGSKLCVDPAKQLAGQTQTVVSASSQMPFEIGGRDDEHASTSRVDVLLQKLLTAAHAGRLRLVEDCVQELSRCCSVVQGKEARKSSFASSKSPGGIQYQPDFMLSSVLLADKLTPG